ncbi:sortase [Pseudarthrobacter sp. J75]|uniref:sortase domain-containing protein n=1 Tax=unclassified Pseudarthrobacter TaxID=2647000 RepID=UPI002E8103E5|nr:MULTISPECIES: sortase [unclassified Pseudarthrobacter]MEE2524573.1 sortase [Pseudarthrobacter sp. J47]MEE2527598.1 sortase [Pseudarthrobacter sp. J75]
MVLFPVRRGGLGASAAAGVLLLLALTGCGMSDGGTSPSASDAPVVLATVPGAASGGSASDSPNGPSVPPGSSAASAAPGAPDAPDAGLPVLAPSAPVTLSIPSIGVRTDLLHLGLRENRSLEVPLDSGNGAPASWYTGSPTPGERGPSVMLGHVNALGGAKGVFADLRSLTPGAEISVTRSDGSTAAFTVDRGATYSKNDFPTFEVYGNTPGAELRLITCDGYDPNTGLFDDNYVVYAKLKA